MRSYPAAILVIAAELWAASYTDMNEDGQAVVGGFEGQEAYEERVQRSEFYLGGRELVLGVSGQM